MQMNEAQPSGFSRIFGKEGSHFSFMLVLKYLFMQANTGTVPSLFLEYFKRILPLFLLNLLSHMFFKWVIGPLRRSYVWITMVNKFHFTLSGWLTGRRCLGSLLRESVRWEEGMGSVPRMGSGVCSEDSTGPCKRGRQPHEDPVFATSSLDGLW